MVYRNLVEDDSRVNRFIEDLLESFDIQPDDRLALEGLDRILKEKASYPKLVEFFSRQDTYVAALGAFEDFFKSAKPFVQQELQTTAFYSGEVLPRKLLLFLLFAALEVQKPVYTNDPERLHAVLYEVYQNSDYAEMWKTISVLPEYPDGTLQNARATIEAMK